MDLEALFKISHGVYITGARDLNNRLIGSCIDSVMVVEADPAQILVSMGKQSYTCENVRQMGKLSLSVLPERVADEVIQNFGMQTSRTADKWTNVPHHLMDELPVLDGAISVMTLSAKVIQETENHFVFLCRVENIQKQGEEKPLIYADYQLRRQAENPKQPVKKWVCAVCGYVYDGEIPFEQLPDTWVCPLCGVPKSDFIQQ